MACTTFDAEKYQTCDEFLFFYKELDFDDSVKHCQKHNSELAKVNITSVDGDKPELRKFSSQLLKCFYRTGLQFKNVAGTWSGKWSNRDKYDASSMGEIQLFNKNQENDECYNLITSKHDVKYKIRCDLPLNFFCRKPENSVTIKPSVTGTYPSEITTFASSSLLNTDVSIPNKKSVYSINTSTKYPAGDIFTSGVSNNPTNQTTQLVIIGVISALFLVSITLLTYICYNKRNHSNQKAQTTENLNLSGLADEGENGRVTSPMINVHNEHNNDDRNEEIELASIELSTYDVFHATVVNERNDPIEDDENKSASIQLSECDGLQTTVVSQTKNQTENEENADYLDDDSSFWIIPSGW